MFPKHNAVFCLISISCLFCFVVIVFPESNIEALKNHKLIFLFFVLFLIGLKVNKHFAARHAVDHSIMESELFILNLSYFSVRCLWKKFKYKYKFAGISFMYTLSHNKCTE